MDEINEVQILTLFPTVIGKTNINRNFSEKELLYIRNLNYISNYGNLASENKNVLESQELSNLKNFCLSSINNYMNIIHQPKNDVSLRITQSWVNITKKNQSHHKHNHPNSIFSASFYIETNEEDRIYFENPVMEFIKIEPLEYTNLNSFSWWLPATKGSLIMFPSQLKHEVKNKIDDGNRISLSFNTFIVGEVGSINDSTQLILQ